MGLIALMLLAGLALRLVAGPPRLPSGLPSANQLHAVLVGSTLPVDWLAYALVSLAWLLWLWIVGSLALELVVVTAETAARGAVWARSLRRLSDRLTLPLVRRAVAAALAVEVLSRGVPIAAAQPIQTTELAFVVQADQVQAPAADQAGATPAEDETASSAHVYHVRAGDTLWSIAQSAYGSGTEYRRIVVANLGRRMSDGHAFSARGVIQPGWDLLVPEPSRHVDESDGERWYTVEAGDTLSGIAARLLHDEARWTDLFELNRGATTPDAAHALSNPNVIWPGLRLHLPGPDSAPSDAAAEAPPEPTAEPPEPPQPEPAAAPATSASPAQPSVSLASAVLPPIERDPLPWLRSLPQLQPVQVEPADPSPTPEPTETTTSPALGLPLPSAETATPLLAAAAAGVAVAAGAALGARRRRRLKPLPHEPESEVVVQGGYAAAELTHTFTRGLQGGGFDPVAAIAGHLHTFVDERGLGGVGIVAMRHGRSSTTLTLAASLAEQSVLLDLAAVFGARIDATVEAWVSSDHDVVWQLVRGRRPRLLPAARSARAAERLFVPLGALPDRQVLFGAWSALGHVLVASLPGHGADVILTSLLATLTARCSPDELRVWLVAEPRSLPGPLTELPHIERTIDPADTLAVHALVEDLRRELDQRAMTVGPHAELVVVVPELGSLGEHAATVELLATPAAALGVRFLAALSSPIERLDTSLVAHFATRMVLHLDEEASVALLGVADAAFLGGGGRLLLRLDGREPVELFGFQVEAEHLERLVRLMRAAYTSGAGPSSRPVPAAGPNPSAAHHAAVPAPVPPTHAWIDPPVPAPAEAAPQPPVAASPEAPSEAPRETQRRAESPLDAAARAPRDAPTTAPATAPREPPTVPPPALAEARPRSIPEPAVSSPSSPTAERVPIQVICFGAPRVLCAGQQVWPRQPAGDAKPWEFLLYLACQPAEGVSRDQLITALWPDDDVDSDTTHRFRQLRYRLRGVLSTVPGAPTTDGISIGRNGPLRLDPTIIHSDAQEFLQLVRLARPSTQPAEITMPRLERARALYAGDLLDGPDVRRYAWADEREDSGVTLREHFRRLFQQATVSLAGLYVETDQLEAAVDVYREAAELDPGDERVWRALFRIHARRGDRPALLREERRMRTILRDLAGAPETAGTLLLDEPSRELSLEFQRLLAGLDAEDRQAAAV